jgi:hypothetical protein
MLLLAFVPSWMNLASHTTLCQGAHTKMTRYFHIVEHKVNRQVVVA